MLSLFFFLCPPSSPSHPFSSLLSPFTSTTTTTTTYTDVTTNITMTPCVVSRQSLMFCFVINLSSWRATKTKKKKKNMPEWCIHCCQDRRSCQDVLRNSQGCCSVGFTYYAFTITMLLLLLLPLLLLLLLLQLLLLLYIYWFMQQLFAIHALYRRWLWYIY